MFMAYNDVLAYGEFGWTKEEIEESKRENTIHQEYREYLKQIGHDIPDLKPDDLPF